MFETDSGTSPIVQELILFKVEKEENKDKLCMETCSRD